MASLVVTKNFWVGKKVVITGHTGFKGSWLSIWLKSLGATVIGISIDPPSRPSLYEKANISDEIISISQDIRDLNAVKKVFQKYSPEIVFHLAAQALVRESYSNPRETISTNAIGSVNVLDALRGLDKKVIAIMITSDKAYDNV